MDEELKKLYKLILVGGAQVKNVEEICFVYFVELKVPWRANGLDISTKATVVLEPCQE